MTGKELLRDKTVLVVDQLKALRRPGKEDQGPFPADFGMENWHWPQGVGLYGLYRLSEITGEPKEKAYLVDWFHRHARQGLPSRHINAFIPLLTATYLWDELGSPYQKACREWAEWMVENLPRTKEGGLEHCTNPEKTDKSPTEGQLWIDTLFMGVLFLARMGQLVNEPRYRSEAILQFLVHIKYLAEKRTGLFYHGWSFPENSNFGGVFWCRGNSWFTASVVDFLELLGDSMDAGLRSYFTGTLRAQVEALAPLQDPSGLWHTVLDDPGTYLEASGSAGIAYGILKGVRLGYLEASWATVGDRALAGLLGCIEPDGVVGRVSSGTGMGLDRDHYQNILVAPMAYGQALTLMALGEGLRHG